MGRLDYWAKRVFNDPQIFADLFNGYLFGGKPVVLPETLDTQNPMEVLQPAENRRMFSSTGKGSPQDGDVQAW